MEQTNSLAPFYEMELGQNPPSLFYLVEEGFVVPMVLTDGTSWRPSALIHPSVLKFGVQGKMGDEFYEISMPTSASAFRITDIRKLPDMRVAPKEYRDSKLFL